VSTERIVVVGAPESKSRVSVMATEPEGVGRAEPLLGEKALMTVTCPSRTLTSMDSRQHRIDAAVVGNQLTLRVPSDHLMAS
jgi:hypothetical protein